MLTCDLEFVAGQFDVLTWHGIRAVIPPADLARSSKGEVPRPSAHEEEYRDYGGRRF